MDHLEWVRRHNLRLPKTEVESECARQGIAVEQLLLQLLPVAQTFSISPISKFKVGAAGLGRSGDVYLGTNIEFPEMTLNQTVHAEQFLLARTLHAGEPGLKAIAVSGSPCGHCRQFLNELADAAELVIIDPDGESRKLSDLLPSQFGPEDLGVDGALLSHHPARLFWEPRNDLEAEVATAFHRSYAPYTKRPAAAGVRAKGQIFTGVLIENAAYNPSLSPLQGVLIEMVARGAPFESIEEAFLLERGERQVNCTKEMLGHVSPRVELQFVRTSVDDVP